MPDLATDTSSAIEDWRFLDATWKGWKELRHGTGVLSGGNLDLRKPQDFSRALAMAEFDRDVAKPVAIRIDALVKTYGRPTFDDALFTRIRSATAALPPLDAEPAAGQPNGEISPEGTAHPGTVTFEEKKDGGKRTWKVAAAKLPRDECWFKGRPILRIVCSWSAKERFSQYAALGRNQKPGDEADDFIAENRVKLGADPVAAVGIPDKPSGLLGLLEGCLAKLHACLRDSIAIQVGEATKVLSRMGAFTPAERVAQLPKAESPLRLVLSFDPEHTEAKRLLASLPAIRKDLTAEQEAWIDAARMPRSCSAIGGPHGLRQVSTAAGETIGGSLDKGTTVLQVAVTGDWFIYRKDPAGRPMTHAIEVWIAMGGAKPTAKGLIRCERFLMLADAGSDGKPTLPFAGWVIQPGQAYDMRAANLEVG
jgi:hypothetical protein